MVLDSTLTLQRGRTRDAGKEKLDRPTDRHGLVHAPSQ
jgi:hypothetical protein